MELSHMPQVSAIEVCIDGFLGKFQCHTCTPIYTCTPILKNGWCTRYMDTVLAIIGDAAEIWITEHALIHIHGVQGVLVRPQLRNTTYEILTKLTSLVSRT